MKRIAIVAVLCSLVMAASAVPARRGWQTRTQADGTTIEVQVIGDEFYHYTINRDGKQVREINGMYVEIGEAPTPAVAKARRAKGVARRQRKDIGTEPNMAPKGVVILANFSNKSMQSGHTQATFNELCNSLNCTVNGGYPSAGQYFADQRQAILMMTKAMTSTQPMLLLKLAAWPMSNIRSIGLTMIRTMTAMWTLSM